YLASPDLYKQYYSLLGDNKKRNKHKYANDVYLAILRYHIRMSTRCTPFGLFAGCSVGTISNETNIELDILTTQRSHIRLDMDYLCRFAMDLGKLPLIRTNMVYFPNNSLYKYGNQLRYIENQYVDDKRVHKLMSVENDDYLQIIIEYTKCGRYMNEIIYFL